jgi:N-acetylmuramoyl-L-alanine amidase
VLVEASWRLGDRFLYHRSPNLRGDDVAELQRRLGQLGFDPGRIDGILGPTTALALQEFQANAGLPPDGICGPETIQLLGRLGRHGDEGHVVSLVREAARLRDAPATLVGRRIVVGHEGGLSSLARTIGRSLREHDASVVVVDEPDGSVQASAANRFGADVYVGLVPTNDTPLASYYATEGFESVGGRRLAQVLCEELHAALPWLSPTPRGMRLPVLRETRMPAVLCELGPVRALLDAGPAVSDALSVAVARWVTEPW